MDELTRDMADSDRFAFGRNWQRFLALVDEERISQAEASLTRALEVESLNGKSFLDIGSGSGLFSLAARRLGARVLSFDYDPQAVACSMELRRRYRPEDPDWMVKRGDVLNADWLTTLDRHDVVYAWGVLHHTGDMWRSLENVIPLVETGGKLFIAIYNDQGRASRSWSSVKRLYNRLPRALRFLVLWPAFARLWGRTLIRDFSRGKPFRHWRDYAHSSRGMSAWRDVVDWVGGYPFEVAKPEPIFEFYKSRGFTLTYLKTCGGGHGCNEFVFEKSGGV